MSYESESAPADRALQSTLALRLMDPSFASSPQPAYRELRRRGPVRGGPGGQTLVLSRAAVDETLRHPEIYSSDGVIMIGNVRPLIPLGVDPPRHVRYRKIMDPLFAPKRMDAIEDDISRRFNNLIDTFIDRRECEFHDEVAAPFPSSIFVGLMGLPESELETLLRFKDGILRSSKDLPPDTPPERVMDAMRESQQRTGQEIYAYFT